MKVLIMNLSNPSLTSCFLVINTLLLYNVFPRNLNLCFSIRFRNLASYPYKNTYLIIVVCILIFTVLGDAKTKISHHDSYDEVKKTS
jgi:hypothetical protein